MKICLACSPGGHLTEIRQLKKLYKKYDYFFLTSLREDTKELNKVYYVEDFKRNLIGFFKNFFQSLKILLKENPDVIITTGAGLVIPSCLIGKLLGVKMIYIESFCRIEKPSLTGKLLYPLTDYFFVQWKKLSKKYGKKAIFVGRVF